jgi:hypothetical protein
MKKRKVRSTLPNCKHKSLHGQCFSLGKSSNKPAKGDADSDSKGSSNGASPTIIERDTVIRLLLKKKKKCNPDEFEDYLVMGIYNKHCIKYFLVDISPKNEIQ